MKRTGLILALILTTLLFAGFADAFEYLPSSVKSMDVTITSTATGTFYGTITRGDKLEILFISPENPTNIISKEEYMEIGADKISPKYTERKGLRYAEYTINDLYEYTESNTFKIVRKIRAKTQAQPGIGEDYNLSDGVNKFTEFTEATAYIESNDPELISKTGIEFNSDSEIETIREITEWVNNNIEYDFDNYYNVVKSAKDTYNTRAGVCDEFANLTAAFLRIKGIPTRYVSGVSYDGERFGSHGWVEAYLPKTGWIGVDSTYGEAGFVDGAHFPIAIAADSNEISDLVLTTTSRKTINIKSELQQPQVEIHSVEFFENLTETKITKKAAVKTGESFEVKAEVKNISGKNTILPIELVMHEEFFMEEGREKLLYLKEGETKEAIWKVRAPEKEIKKGYYEYEMLLILPDSNKTEKIRVERGTADKEPGIAIIDVSPFINENKMRISISLKNSGAEEENVQITVTINGETQKESAIVEAFWEKTYSIEFDTNGAKEVMLEIETTEEIKQYNINIPEKPEIKNPDSDTISTNMPELEELPAINLPGEQAILAIILIIGSITILTAIIKKH